MEYLEDDLRILHAGKFGHLNGDDFQLLLAECRNRGIPPYCPHLYVKHQWNEQAGRNELKLLLAIDGFRSQAIESGEFAGTIGPHYCDDDWQWSEGWLGKGEFPFAAKFGAIRKGFPEPCFRIARWDEFAQFDDRGNLMEFWARMPCHMLGLRAEAMALRACFPQKLGGIYLPEELIVRPGQRTRPDRMGAQRETAMRIEPAGDLHDALADMGYESEPERETIIAQFQKRWPLLAENNPREFMLRVSRAIKPKRTIVPIAE